MKVRLVECNAQLPEHAVTVGDATTTTYSPRNVILAFLEPLPLRPATFTIRTSKDIF